MMNKPKANPNPDHYLRIIDRMLDNEDYHYAKETLHGIHQTISEAETVTDKQITAIFNIRRSTRF